MLKNYLKVAWRHLLQNKGFSFINSFGLAIGMAFAILIGLWIQYETSFDNFHKNGDRIGRLMKHVDPDFLDMFSFPVIKGNKKTALNDLYSMIISESLATALFGKEDPIGK